MQKIIIISCHFQRSTGSRRHRFHFFCTRRIRQEVITVIGIGIIGMNKTSRTFIIIPFDNPATIEKKEIVATPDRHGRNIINIRSREIFIQHTTAIPMYGNLGRIREPHSTQVGICQFIKSSVFNLYLHPFAGR